MTNFHLSHGYEVLSPREDKALPIPCNEWRVLKEKIKQLTLEPWFFQTTGSTLMGAGIATLISIFTGAISDASVKNAGVIAWAISLVTIFVGAACLFFANKERAFYKSRAGDVVTQMDLIEQRFEISENTF